MAKTRNRDSRRLKKSQSKHPNRQITQRPHHQDRWDVTQRRQMIQEYNAANRAVAQRRRHHRRRINTRLYPLLVLAIGAAAIYFSQSR